MMQLPYRIACYAGNTQETHINLLPQSISHHFFSSLALSLSTLVQKRYIFVEEECQNQNSVHKLLHTMYVIFRWMEKKESILQEKSIIIIYSEAFNFYNEV